MSTPDQDPQGPDSPGPGATPPADQTPYGAPNPYAQQPQQQPPPGPAPQGYAQAPYGYGQAPYGYGQAPYGYGYPQPYQPYGPQSSQKALWSMILGIGSIVGATVLFCFYVLGIGLGIPAIILGILARKEINASGGGVTGSGQATAGLVTGIIGIILNLLFIVLMIVVFATEGFGDPSWNY